MDFRSDNISGVAPEILDAIAQVNQGTVGSYGDDPHTAKMNERDLRGETRQERGLLERGISPADDRDRLASEKESVTRGTRRDTVPHEPAL